MSARKVRLTHEELTRRGVAALERKHAAQAARQAAAAPDVILMREMGRLRSQRTLGYNARFRMERLQALMRESRFMDVLQAAATERRVQILEVFAGVWAQLKIDIHNEEAPFR